MIRPMRAGAVGLTAIFGVLLSACPDGDTVDVTGPSTKGSGTVVHSVTVTPSSIVLNVGDAAFVSASVDADAGVTDRTVTWSSSNSSIVSVGADGKLTGVSAGTATVKATSKADGTVSGAALVTVNTAGAGTVTVSYITVSGTYSGAVNFTTNTATPGALGLLPSCSASTEYTEGVVLSLNASGVGTAAIVDAPTFPRTYQITLNSSFMGTSSGSFPFLGSTIPGWMSMSISGTTLTYRETTQYGTCANSYSGDLKKN